MHILDPIDPSPAACLDLSADASLARGTAAARDASRTRPSTALDALDEALRRPSRLAAQPDEGARSAAVDLPDLATRIEAAQQQARARRVQQGLPPDPDDGAYALKRPRKHAAKRGKKHGHFLGTVGDSWQGQPRQR